MGLYSFVEGIVLGPATSRRSPGTGAGSLGAGSRSRGCGHGASCVVAQLLGLVAVESRCPLFPPMHVEAQVRARVWS